MLNRFSSPSDMQGVTALGRGGIDHDDSLNAFDHQPPSYQPSELFGSGSLAPPPHTFNDEIPTFANLEHGDIPMDLPSRLSTLDSTPQTFQHEEMVHTSYVSNEAAVSAITQSDIRKHWATEHEWTKHRALITELYGENKLRKVMSIMESQQGFRATVKMYKSHIAKWGLDKKNKEPEMRAIVRKNEQRAGQGKRSNFLVRKRQLDFAEVVRYWQRKGMTIDEVVARSIASPTPEAIECFTPPVSSPMTPPEDLANPEYILRIIRGYIAASFESGIWVKTDPWDGCYSIKDGRNADCYCDFADLSNLAAWSFSTHNFEEAEKSMSDVFAISRKMIIAEQPDLLPVFLRRIVSMPRTREHEIALRIIHQFSTTSKELLGEKHPLCLFWTRFAAIPWSQTEDVISRCFRVITDDFESLLGPVHMSTWSCRLSISELDINLAILRKLVNTCESALGSYDGRTLHVRVWLMDCTFKTGHYAKAKRLGEDILASLHEIQEVLQSESDWWFSIASWEIIARCQYALGEPHLAIQSLEVAVHLGIMNYLAQAEPLSTLIITLERWYIKQGQMNEAIAARNRWFKLLKGPTLRGAFQNGLGGLTERMRIERQIENHG